MSVTPPPNHTKKSSHFHLFSHRNRKKAPPKKPTKTKNENKNKKTSEVILFKPGKFQKQNFYLKNALVVKNRSLTLKRSYSWIGWLVGWLVGMKPLFVYLMPK